jgi:hypothetical protein
MSTLSSGSRTFYGVDPEDAEAMAAEWNEALGETEWNVSK